MPRVHHCAVAVFAAVLLATLNVDACAHPALSSAVATLDAEIAADPTHGDLYLQRAQVHTQLGHWEAALSDYADAQRYGVSADLVQRYRGQMYSAAGRHREALDSINARLAVEPDDILALTLRAKNPLHDPRIGINDLNRVLALTASPTPDLYLARAKLMAQRHTDDCTPVSNGLGEGLDRLGPLVSLISFAAAVCEETGEPARAVQMINRLPPPLRNTAKWQSRLGDLYLQAKDAERAVDHFRAASRWIASMPEARRSSRAMRALSEHIAAQLVAADQ